MGSRDASAAAGSSITSMSNMLPVWLPTILFVKNFFLSVAVRRRSRRKPAGLAGTYSDRAGFRRTRGGARPADPVPGPASLGRAAK